MTAIDIVMPLRAGAPLRGAVIAGIVAQDVEWSWYLNVQETPPIDEGQVTVLERLSASRPWTNQLRHGFILSGKREWLRDKGKAPFVYSADTDVILPPGPVLRGMAAALEQNPTVGSVGLRYDFDWPGPETAEPLRRAFMHHVGCGSMMLRREDFAAIGPLRATPCECTFIRNRLLELGKVTVLIWEGTHAHQWKRSNLRAAGGPH
jgi:hypothetical protein